MLAQPSCLYPPGAGLGTRPPRIKVQVKRQADKKIDAPELRAFMAVVGDQDVGIYVSAGGFTTGAQREARAQERRSLTLIDLDRLIRLWIEHWDKLDDAARLRLPLKPVYISSLRPTRHDPGFTSRLEIRRSLGGHSRTLAQAAAISLDPTLRGLRWRWPRDDRAPRKDRAAGPCTLWSGSVRHVRALRVRPPRVIAPTRRTSESRQRTRPVSRSAPLAR
jgi:hypothetical protein